MSSGSLGTPVTAPPVPPSRDDPVVRGASELLGGPRGRHARQPGRRRALAVLLALTALTCFAAWVQKAPCRTHPWTGNYQYTRLCYSDVQALYYAEHLDAGQVPYAQSPVEYPVVIGGLMYAVARVTAAVAPPDSRGTTFFDLTALVLAVAALVTTATTAALAGPRPWDAAMVALAPVLVLHAYTNWDLAAVALAGAALLAWARRRPVLAGVLLGLGTATKLYPALFLVPLLALCLRERRLRAWAAAALAAAAAWLVVDLPIWVAHPSAFGRFWALNRSRGADWDSLWYAAEQVSRSVFGWVSGPGVPTALNALVAVATLAVLAAVVVLALRAPYRPRLPQLLFLALTGFLLVNKVDSPQYVLWLLPLAVLARPRWPAILAWQATEAALLFFRFYFFVGNANAGQGVGYPWFGAAVLLRDAALVTLAVLVVRDVLHPERDVVRRAGMDDPAGGVLVTG